MQLLTLAGLLFSLAALTGAVTCPEERQRLGTEMPGKFVPQCNAGKYKALQCYGSTGYCWCVDPETGKELSGTRRGPTEGQVVCTTSDFSEPISFVSMETCAEKRQRAGPMIPGKYIPQCTASGDYQPRQCHGSTGSCWNVDPKTGQEIAGTRVGPGRGKRSSQYKSIQCNGSTGYCWCVDPETGKELPGTRRGPTEGQVVCTTSDFSEPISFVSMETCAEKRQRAGPMIPGKYIPQCTASGDYQPRQCHGSTGSCWNVDPKTGQEIAGTRVGPGRGKRSMNIGSCAEELKHVGPMIPGKYVPQCTSSGQYKPIQCNGSTGYCWCVDETGKELAGTRVAPGFGPPSCHGAAFAMAAPVHMGACAEERQRAGPMIPGKFIPQCASSGKYLPKQCNGSTGACWCVNMETGEEVPNTRVGAGGRDPPCYL